jgi:O-antigen/teichoic acid export membrane protein
VSDAPASWAPGRERQIVTVARNISTRYLAIAAEMALGVIMLPFNLAHFGAADYGLLVLVGSITIHFSVLDLGYSGALVKFMAQYRAHRDARALNEIASTLFFVFTAVGLLAYGVAVAVAFNLDVFRITPEQEYTGMWMLLIIGLHVALNFPFAIYGGVISGFQRFDVNNVVAIGISVAVAAANVTVLLTGSGLVALVAGTTFVRIVGYFIYRRNAYRIFPELRISPSLFRRDRLREVTGFSIYSSIIDWANKLNYQLDEIVIGVVSGVQAVAVWAVAERVISGTQRLTNQLNGVLFPVVVDSDASQRQERLQQILTHGTLLSLAMVVPVAVALILLAEPFVRLWVGPAMLGAVPVIQLLALAVVIRVGNATATTVLKGAGRHRFLAWVNLSTGLVNVALSVALIGAFGLPGVAIGTLIPIAAASIFVVQPAACRRVGLPLRVAFARSVVPAIWPAFVVGAALMFTRHISSGTFLAVCLQAAVAGLLYLALLFGVAIRRKDRELYVGKLLELAGRRGLTPARA